MASGSSRHDGEASHDTHEDQTPSEQPSDGSRSPQVAERNDGIQDGHAGPAKAGSRGPVVGGGFPRIVLLLAGLAAALVALSQLQLLKDYVAPIFLAINLMLTAAPLQSFLARHRVPKLLASVISGIIVFAFLVAFFWALGYSISSLVSELPKYREQFNNLWSQSLGLLDRFGISQDQVADQLKAIDPNSVVSALTGVLSNVGGSLSLLSVVLITVFFLMIDASHFGDRLRLARSFHPRFADALAAFGEGVRRYWLVTTVFGLIVAILDYIALVIIGVPLALVWAVLSFLTNYIPNIGFVIGLVPPALMALLALGPTQALIVVIAYSVLNFVMQSLIQPKFTGDAVGVTPTLTFISLLIWTWALGPLGALLALPATLLVKAIVVDADPNARWVNALIASDPDTARADTAAEAVSGEDADPAPAA